jgi:hypothetical protein
MELDDPVRRHDGFPTAAVRLVVNALSQRRFSCSFLSGNPRIGHAKSGLGEFFMASRKIARDIFINVLW